jgi:hypothetical protein
MQWIKGERKLPQEGQDNTGQGHGRKGKDRATTGQGQGQDSGRTEPRQVKVRDKIVEGQGQDR